MQSISTIGLDIAKSVFQVHGVDSAGQVILRRQADSIFSRRVFSHFGPGAEHGYKPTNRKVRSSNLFAKTLCFCAGSVSARSSSFEPMMPPSLLDFDALSERAEVITTVAA